jgi:CheY-like chemotaxis protein
MPAGGKLTITMSRLDLDRAHAAEHAGVEAGPHVLLEVNDTGLGMDQATQARIFEPFFTTKEVGKGTGLGLSTVFGIVRQSSGTVWVESERGAGTTFSICLPEADPGWPIDSISAPEPDLALPRGGETILLVEDDERVRRLTRTVLRRHGYHVLEAQSGGDALLIGEQHQTPIDLMLTDVVMPRMSGGQLAERMRMVRPGLRVVFMSGYPDGSIVSDRVLSVDVDFIQKPIAPEALLSKIRRVLDTPARTRS